MSQPNSQTSLPSSQPLPPDQPLQCEGSKHTQLHITTDPGSSSSLSQSLPVTNNRPESPLNRKRAEAKDEDSLYGLEQHHGQDGVPLDSNGHSSLPPLKKSKTSLALSQANMTEYRSSQDYIDDQLSPQTSPVLEPISPASSVSSSSNAQLHRRPSPVDATVPPVIPLLTRSSTLEEIKPTTSLSLPNESETAIENLSLGTRSSTVPGRGPGLERAMGVITTSRQGSPALGIVDMTTRETTPMLMEEEIVQHLEASQITTDSCDPRDLSSSVDTMDTAGHGYLYESRLEPSDCSENEDADYELAADTTVDENSNRIDTSESEDDDSFSDIHINNIASNNYDNELRGNTYTDLDPMCLDRLTQEEKEVIMEEAREFDLLQNSKNIMVLTGAGVSVSCGIPDFRSPDGIYSRLSEFELDDPTQMFELEFFSEKPEVFYSFAREIFPSNFTPSPSHNFIKMLEDQGKLLRNYTQNIDTLEQKAGISNVLQCHGSFATASCIRCKHQVPGDDIKESIFKQQVAYCKVCRATSPVLQSQTDVLETIMESAGEHNAGAAVMKPDIVFFGERLPSAFDDNFDEDRDKADLLIVIGSSLKVAPVSDIMHQLPRSIPQILINRTPITHMEFDVQLLGNCDTIAAELCRMAGWELKHEKLPGGTSNIPDMDTNSNADGSGKDGRAHWSLIEPNTYLFEGAILGDIEYESSQNSSKKRGRFARNDMGGYEADSDEDGGNLRRRSFGRAGRTSSPGLMDTDCDSDDDSDESQGTIRGIQSSLLFDGTMETSLEETLELSPGFVVGATESLSASIPEIHLPEASYSQESSLLDYSNMVNNSHFDDQEKENDNSKDYIESTERVPRDLVQSEQDDEFGSLHVDHRQIIDLESIVEDLQSENVSGRDSSEKSPMLLSHQASETKPFSQQRTET
ncbi:NAD-dependent histone deacetylase sir2 [Mortierella sp. AD094]|nr:NAD-dependent histone deacetylase sir2 [Mortierella sp. AD094]